LGNLLKASEEFQQTRDWVRYPTNSETPTVNDDSRPDPNGGTTADQVDYTANTSARLMQTVTLSASTEYTFSVHARAVSGSVDFRMRNITLKAAVQKTATTTGPLTNGFTRFTFTFTTGAAGSYELALQNASGTPTARSVIFWGAMLNQGGTAAEYEYAAPTTGGSAPAPAYAGFGDAFGGVTAYYSLRQFTEAETLNAIRVRRSSDDTEQDIGFDANGDLDSTALLAFVNEDVDTYTSDFTSGNEDLVEVNGTGADGQSIAGVDDAYKFTLSGGSANHRAQINSAFDLVNTYNLSLEYYIPSGQTINGIRVRTGASADGEYDQTTLDAWTTVTIENWTPTSSGDLRIYSLVTPNSLVIDADGDVFYLKNIVVTQTTADGAVTTWYDQSGNGNDATNSTESEQPLVVSGGTLVEADGNAAVDFNQDLNLQLNSPIAANDDFFISSVLYIDSSNGQYILNTDLSTGYNIFIENNDVYLRNQSGIVVSNTSLPQNWNLVGLNLLTVYTDSSNAYVVAQETDTSSSYTTRNNLDLEFIGSKQGGRGYLGKLSEMVVFESDQSTNRTGIEGNIDTYFDIV